MLALRVLIKFIVEFARLSGLWHNMLIELAQKFQCHHNLRFYREHLSKA